MPITISTVQTCCFRIESPMRLDCTSPAASVHVIMSLMCHPSIIIFVINGTMRAESLRRMSLSMVQCRNVDGESRCSGRFFSSKAFLLYSFYCHPVSKWQIHNLLPTIFFVYSTISSVLGSLANTWNTPASALTHWSPNIDMGRCHLCLDGEASPVWTEAIGAAIAKSLD